MLLHELLVSVLCSGDPRVLGTLTWVRPASLQRPNAGAGNSTRQVLGAEVVVVVWQGV